MYLQNFAIFSALLASGVFAAPAELSDRNVNLLPFPGPGKYYIQNQATSTVMDLFNGNPAQGTPLKGYGLGKGNAHQIFHVVAAGPNSQYLLINSATGSIASCGRTRTGDGYFPAVGGEVPVNGDSLFTLTSSLSNLLILDNVYQFANVGDPSLCLDLARSDPTSGTPIICYPCHPGVGKNQNWVFIPA